MLAETCMQALRLIADKRERKAAALLSEVRALAPCFVGETVLLGRLKSRMRHYLDEHCIRDHKELDRASLPELQKAAKREKLRRNQNAHRLRRRR